MRLVRGVGTAAAVVLAVSLLGARVHPYGDAGLYKTNDAPAIAEHAAMPAEVRALLTTKCADCHSSVTRSPVYGRLAPASWLMERDIVEARKRMNLSQWDSYSPEEQETLKAKMVQETKSGDMPALQYRAIHWSARMTSADLDLLTRWAHEGSATEVVQAGLRGDAARGQAVFEKRCSGCHALDTSREGPRLRGVFGRTSGSVPGFPYSTGLRDAHVVWNESSLDKWLADPETLISSSNMDFRVPKAQERQDLIAFLKSGAAK